VSRKKRVDQAVRGRQGKAAGPRLADGTPLQALWEQYDREALKKKLSDCDLYDTQSVAHEAGFGQARYFLEVVAKTGAAQNSCWHLHPLGNGQYATRTNSAHYGREQYEKYKQPSRDAARARVPGWRKKTVDLGEY
jgi:hypothetical protein